MTRRDTLSAEQLAAAIATSMIRGAIAGTDACDHGVTLDRGGMLRGDQLAGWRSYFRRRADPPGTLDGWAGWLAAGIASEWCAP